MKYLVLLGLVLSSSAFVKRDVGSNLFTPGKEYVYDMSMFSKAGSQDYVAFASIFNITGRLHVSSNGNELNVKLDDLEFGAYNGEYDMHHDHEYSHKSYSQLQPLTEAFSVHVKNGMAKGVSLNQNVDEWAHNIKRGIATALQLDLEHIQLAKHDNFVSEEETVVGDCKTDYIVIPKEDDNHAPTNAAQVRKFRSHAQCQNVPRRMRKPGVHVEYCPDDNSRDVLNSTGFGIYDLEVQSGSLVAKSIKVGSTLIYNVFGVDGHTQYSFTKLTLTLDEVKSGSVSGPSNAKSYNDLRFEFENDMSEDEDLKSPQPFFFHHKGQDLDSAGQNRAIDKLIENIKKVHESLENVEVFKDTKEFHKVGPFSLIPFVSALDYQHLKQAYDRVKGGDETEYKLFLDSLVVSGTGPAALVLRDIASTEENTVYLARIIAPLANYIRNPTENLVKEFESLIKPGNSKHNSRIIEFAFATLLGRACEKTGCQKTGLLNKWVKYWSDKIDGASSFDDKTQAVIALRNIDLLPSAEKLLQVLEDKNEDRSVRSAAMSGLKALLKKDRTAFKDHLMAIFYDKQEDSELRNTALQWTLMAAPEENMFQEVAISTWMEKDIQVKNFVKTLFESISDTTRPCLKHRASWAKTALQMMGHFDTNPKYSGTYLSDYHDEEFNFGHMTAINVQKNGHSILPRTLYAGFFGQTAGYGTHYLSVFVRLEGLGKAVSSRLMSMFTGIDDFEEVEEVLQQIGVKQRHPDPLRIEIAVLLHGRVVGYHAADQKTVTTIPQIIKKIAEMRNKEYDREYVRMMLIGGVTTEQPNELGIPVSTVSAVSALASVHAKASSEKSGSTMFRKYDLVLQFNMHGISGVNNHLTPFGSAHSVEALRTMRIRVPRKMKIGFDIKQKSIAFVLDTPTEESPVKAMVHATAFTAVQSDAPASMRDQEVVGVLHETCPDCKGIAIISKGDKFREERRIGSGYKPRILEGITYGAKYFDCEKIHSRVHVLRQLRKFFTPDNKNLGGRLGRPITLIRLGLRYLLQTLFLSPATETCGMKAWLHHDSSLPTYLTSIEGQAKMKRDSDPKGKLGSSVHVKSSLNLKFEGTQPKTKTVNIGAAVQKVGLEKVQMKLKVSAKDESNGKQGAVCVDLSSETNKVSDFFDYTGANEPTYERSINVAWTKDVTKDGGCPSSSAGLRIKKVAHRSQAQKEEAESDRWPYKQCREAKASPKYPGSLTPATEPCVWAAYKQTSLRESNITIKYKVDPDARKRWRYPGIIAAAILMPYHVDSDQVDGHAGHGHEHGRTSDGYIQGEIELDVRMDDDHPEADIHWHSSQGEEEHFHHVDLNFLPGPLKRPVYSRFSKLQYMAFKYGIYAYCDVTPHAVQTFDNRTYYADLSECHTLISGDCSDTPRYVVLGKKISDDKVGVKIMMGEHVVEMNDLNTVTIDGKSKPLSEEIITPEEDSGLFKIYKHDDNNVFLLSQSLSVYVRYTGHYTTVTAGSRYRATNCGLCGNFDGCGKNDLTGPDTSCKNLAPSDMTKAYIVREGNCAGVGSACPSS